MGSCWNCDTEITLGNGEVICDNCRKPVTYKCWKCKTWFEVNGEQCKTCGFYVCSNCDTCGPDCQKDYWKEKLKEILGKEIESKKIGEILDLIEEIKIGKEQRCCPLKVSISYAKSRIKRCYVKILGYKIRDEKDLNKFKERFEQVGDVELGKTLTISKSREAGSYGQEFRDVFNLAICMGKLKKVKKKFNEGDKEIKYEAYERCERGTCPKFHTKDLIVKRCPNKDCKIKIYPENETHCICPECKYKKGEKSGELRRLRLKVSNKDICQLNRGDFKKEDGEDESSQGS